MEESLCPNCGKKLKIKKCINETQAIMRCKQCRKDYSVTFDEKAFSKKFNTFNWGAFGLGWIWCLYNGKIGTAILLLFLGFFTKIPYIGFVFSIPIVIIGIILGVRGNKIVWNNKRWNSIEDFEKALKAWNIAGILFIIITFIFCICNIFYLNSL